MKKNIKKFLFMVITVCFGVICTVQVAAQEENDVIYETANEINISVSASTGADTSVLTDRMYNSYVNLGKTDTLTVKAADGGLFYGIYIIWNSPVREWTLETDSGSIVCGKNGFLHEYVSIPEGTAKAVIHLSANDSLISEVRIFGEGNPPADIQVWQPPCEKADIMLISSHADDEILFFGGIIPTYSVVGDAAIQVVYMSQYWWGERVREHERLDGIWAAGIRNYPICSDFDDVYSENLETARSQYDENKIIAFIVEQIRRFRPQVTVTHDFNGEYGHGYHMLIAHATSLAVTSAADASEYEESADVYGIWDTPKSYYHLYPENEIELNLRIPIESMGGRTALEVAADAYKLHVSQQWCWFYVSDDYKYSCAKFGLYRTTVGADTGNDMLENIKTYAAQEAERLEAERIERERLEQESLEQESREQESLEQESRERESLKQESVRESIEQESLKQESIKQESIRAEREKEEADKADRQKKNVLAAVIVVAALTFTFVLIKIFIVPRNNSKAPVRKRRRR